MAVTAAALSIKISANVSDIEKSLKGVEASFKRTGAQLQSIGRGLTSSLTLPIVGFATVAIKASRDFESAMTRVSTVGAEATVNLSAMRAEVLALAPTVGIGPTALADALTAIVSNGQHGADAMAILTSSAKASAVGFGETADIGRAVTAVLNAYGKENYSAAQATDILVKTIQVGGAEANQLAPELGRVIGVAHSLGVSFQEVGAFIATYTQLGIPAAEATTALSGVLNTILAPSSEARKALAGLGLSAADLRKQVSEQGLGAALTGLMGKLKGNEDATAALFGNVRALAGVMGTAGSQAAAYAQNLHDIQNSTGTLDAVFQQWRQTTAATWDEFKARIEVAAIALGDQLAPSLSKALNNAEPLLSFIGGLAKAFGDLPGPVQAAAIGVTALAAAVGPVVYLWGNLLTAGGSVLSLIRVMATEFRALAAAQALSAEAGAGGLLASLGAAGVGTSALAVGAAGAVGVGAGMLLDKLTIGGLSPSEWVEFLATWRLGMGDVDAETANLAITSRHVAEEMEAAKRSWAEQFGRSPNNKGDINLPAPIAAPSAGRARTGGGGVVSASKAFTGFSDAFGDASKRAREYMTDLGRVGGLTHLTQTQQSDLNRVLTSAVDIYTALGRVAPKVWTDTLAAMKPLESRSLPILAALAPSLDLPPIHNLATTGNVPFEKSGAGSGRSLQELLLNAGMNGAPTVESGGNIADKLKENDAATKAWKFSLSDLSSSFSELAQVAGGSLSSVARTLGTVISAAKVGAEGFGNLKGGFGQFKDALGGNGGFMGALGGIGGMISGVMGMISSAIQLGKSLAHAFGWKSRSEKAVSGFNKDFGTSSVSEDFAKSILDQAKAQFGGNIDAAKIMNLGGFIEQAGGLNAGNIGQMSARLHDVFSMIETGAVSAAQGAQVLDETFQQFADYALKQGPLVSQQLIDIIHLNDQFGTHSAAVSEFVKSQAGSAVSGLQTFVNSGTTTPITAQGAQGLGAAAGAIFGGLLNENVPATEILAQLGPIVTQLDAMFKKAGVDGGAAFGEVLRLSQLLSSEIAGPGIQAVSGLNQVLQGLHNSGLMTQEIFSGVSNQVATTFNDLVAKGSNASDVLKLMQPSLQTIWELQKQFGYSVDAATQSLLNQAVAAGVVGAAHQSIEQQSLDIQKQQLDVLNAIAGVFGVAIPTAMTATGAATDALSQKFQRLAGIAGSVGPAVGSTGIRVAAPSGGTLPGTLPRASAPTTGTVTPTPTPTVTNREGALTVNIQSVYGSVDANFAQSLARTISLGGTTKTAWQGALK